MPLISHYDFEIIEPGCAPGSGRYGLRIVVVEDISEIMAYINAIADNAWYDHENRTLILKESRQAYALRRHEVRVGRLAEPSMAAEMSSKIVQRLNAIWDDRANIQPRLTTRKLPSIIDILKLLPRTNCRQCGYLTCLAFAAALRSSEADVEACSPLQGTAHEEQRRRISELCDSSASQSSSLSLLSP